MPYIVVMWMLNPAHSLIHSLTLFRLKKWNKELILTCTLHLKAIMLDQVIVMGYIHYRQGLLG